VNLTDPFSRSTLTAGEKIAILFAALIGLTAALRFLVSSSPTWNTLLLALNAPGFVIAAVPFALLGGLWTAHGGIAAVIAMPFVLFGNPVVYSVMAYGLIRLRRKFTHGH
jgi:hypothetical protein